MATPTAAGDVHDNFTLALWARPTADTKLHAESNSGAGGLAEPRNDALYPPHGNTFGGGNRAGSGLAVGRNGLCVFEHGAAYFAPVLVHAVPLEDWTHIAVVYRDGQPSLYLNGAPVHTGLQSTYTVYPGTAAGGGGRPFQGELGAVEMIPRALQAEEIAALGQSMVRPGVRPPGAAVELSQDAEGRVSALAWQPGQYTLGRADGTQRTIRVDAIPKPFDIAGPWNVHFDPRWGGPESCVFEELSDWTRHADDGIKHYSGTATYRTTFELPAGYEDQRLWIDLGKVCDLAVVRLNGQPLGTRWMTPWRVEITQAVRVGNNVLEVDVINTWNNRLVGDSTLPAAQRRTYLALPILAANAPLLPAGLLGPVRIEAATQVGVE